MSLGTPPPLFFMKDTPEGQPRGTTNRQPPPTANRQPPPTANSRKPPTANRHQPPTIVQSCFCGLVSCPYLDHEAESVPVNIRFCWRYEPSSSPRPPPLRTALPAHPHSLDAPSPLSLTPSSPSESAEHGRPMLWLCWNTANTHQRRPPPDTALRTAAFQRAMVQRQEHTCGASAPRVFSVDRWLGAPPAPRSPGPGSIGHPNTHFIGPHCHGRCQAGLQGRLPAVGKAVGGRFRRVQTGWRAGGGGPRRAGLSVTPKRVGGIPPSPPLYGPSGPRVRRSSAGMQDHREEAPINSTHEQGCPQETQFFLLLRTALQDSPKGPPTANHQPPPTANRQPPPTANHQPPPTANRCSIPFLSSDISA